MKHYRIITNGDSYRVQKKGWFGWVTLGDGGRFNYSPWRAYEFYSLFEARDFIHDQVVRIESGTEWTVV